MTLQNGIGASSILKTPKTSSIAILRNIPVVTGQVLSAPFSFASACLISLGVIVVPTGILEM